ncbi:hypothetical protein ACFL5O_07900 [Myxococcota bacterium]
MNQARSQLVRLGPNGRLGDVPVRELGAQLLDIATGGLRRRARLDDRQCDESKFLSSLSELLASGRTPSDQLVEGLPNDATERAREIVRRTRLGPSADYLRTAAVGGCPASWCARGV